MIESDDLDLLSGLYDRFAHALDPFSEDRDLAERQFFHELTRLFEMQPDPRPSLKEFQKKAVVMCRARLRSTDKPKGI